jgi:hypothetical protein
MKKALLIAILVFALCLPAASFGKKVFKEGSIQGFYRVCEGKLTCSPQEELIAAALEEVFVLIDDNGEGYLLPNLKSSVLRRLLNKPVRIMGRTTFDGKAIMVSQAETYRDGEWEVFFTPELAEEAYRKLRTPKP